MLQVIHCIEDGLPLLIENLPEDIDIVLDNVIGKKTITRGRATIVKIGDTEVELNPHFRYGPIQAGYPVHCCSSSISCLVRSVHLQCTLPALQCIAWCPCHRSCAGMLCRLYLATKIANPHYRPEIAAQTTLVKFCVTEEGMEEQLLASVVDHERPDLQQAAAALTAQLAEYTITLTGLEDNLLSRLSNSQVLL